MSGFNNMLHFMGVVEDTHDQTNSGRVRVRAFGIHPPKDGQADSEGVPTAHLPWATVLDGTYGLSPIIPSVGDWVFGFFIDGREAQSPIIIGRMPGMNLSFPHGSGEPGEDGYIPPESIHKYGEPELHRYNTGEDADKGQTILQRSYQYNNISQADGQQFDEPPIITPENNLNNRVIQSKNGDNFVVIGDGQDTESGDYMLISHSSGSVFQIDSNGTILMKSFGDTYHSVDGVESRYVTGSSHTNIQEDYTLKIEKGSGKIFINGDLDIECENFNVNARNQVNLNASVKTNISGGGVGIFSTVDDVNVMANGSMKTKVGNLINRGGFYVAADFGDIHLDSYKMNLYSTSYTKIYSLGTPSVSVQTLPFPDAGHLGVDISSKTSMRLDALATMNINTLGIMGINSGAALGIKSIGTLDIHSTAQLGIGATALLNIDGLLVNIGNLTSVATGALATTSIAASIAPQIIQKATGTIPNVSITERAKVVLPPDIPGSRPAQVAITERALPAMTSTMGSGDNLNVDK
tara:strand:- start:3565 stop:5130 length:1566 start_codon:yes stop_codon:yes gene_type:complete